MVSVGQLLTFALAAFALIVVPGPSVLFVISRGLSLGRSGAIATVVGNAIGECVQIAAVTAGLGALVAESAAAFAVLKLAGAAYLIYLGISAIRHRRRLSVALGDAGLVRSLRRAAWDGFFVGATNPKSMIFFAAVLPQFVDRGAGGVAVQMLVLGLIFIAIALLSDSVWAFTAGAARTWFARSPRRLELIGGAGGLVTIGLGLQLAATGRKD